MNRLVAILIGSAGLIAIWVVGLIVAIAVGPTALHGSRVLYLIREGLPRDEPGSEIARLYIVSDLRGAPTSGPVRIRSRHDLERAESLLTLERKAIVDPSQIDDRVGRIRALLADQHADVVGATLDAWAADMDRLARLLVEDPRAAWILAESTKLEYDSDGSLIGPPLSGGWSFHVTGPGEAPYTSASGLGAVLLIWLGIAGAGTVGVLVVARRIWVSDNPTRQSNAHAA